MVDPPSKGHSKADPPMVDPPSKGHSKADPSMVDPLSKGHSKADLSYDAKGTLLYSIVGSTEWPYTHTHMHTYIPVQTFVMHC